MVKRSRTFNVADVQEQEFGVVASTSYSSSSNGNGTLDSAAFLSSSLGSTVASSSSSSNSRTLPNPKKKNSNKDKGPSKTPRNGVGGGAILLSAGDAAEQVRSKSFSSGAGILIPFPHFPEGWRRLDRRELLRQLQLRLLLHCLVKEELKLGFDLGIIRGLVGLIRGGGKQG